MSISLKEAITTPNQFITTHNGKIAYRSLGEGLPIILCNRFRGTLDTWDPKFISHLAKRYRVIMFDYHGIGLSTGEHATTPIQLADELKAFLDALKIKSAIIGGWSYGALVAQGFAALYPKMVSHLIVIGSNPIGKSEIAPEQIFFDTALKPVNDFVDEIILFFEPNDQASRVAAKKSHDRIALRKKDLDIPVSPEQFNNYFQGGIAFKEDSIGLREKLYQSSIPILVLMGDHDPSFPIENWFAMIKNSSTMQLIIISKTGHGPQHQHPKLCADYMNKFILNTRKAKEH